ncbi:MAG TPA: hypothetical protein VK943_19685 [Arenibaculum sp.]|nr:hypothetical protein [Arenibaculum sp.]
MLRILPSILASLLLAVTLPAPPAAAQEALPSLTDEEGVSREAPPDWPGDTDEWHTGTEPEGADPDEAETRGLTDADVRESQGPESSPQGTRSPESLGGGTPVLLADLLRDFRRAPPGLDGRPIQRPNPLASEPGVVMEPHPNGDIQVLFPDNYIE